MKNLFYRESVGGWRDRVVYVEKMPEKGADRPLFNVDQLAELRKARGLTQQQVAEVMGVSQRRVSAVERGDVDRSEISTLRSYVEALGGQIRIVAEFSEESALIA